MVDWGYSSGVRWPQDSLEKRSSCLSVSAPTKLNRAVTGDGEENGSSHFPSPRQMMSATGQTATDVQQPPPCEFPDPD